LLSEAWAIELRAGLFTKTIFAKDLAIFVSSVGPKSLILRIAARERDALSGQWRNKKVENDHAMFPMACAFNARMFFREADARACISGKLSTNRGENAQDAFARC